MCKNYLGFDVFTYNNPFKRRLQMPSSYCAETGKSFATAWAV